jgi:hypothetical protein
MRSAADAPVELEFMRRLMLALGQHRDVCIWRQNVGKVPVRDHSGKTVRVFDAGPPKGAADLSGFVRPEGWRLEIEVKGARGKRSPAQETFARVIETGGGVYVLADYARDLTLEENVSASVAMLERAIAARRAKGAA